MIKLIVTDMDGTLLSNDSTISNNNIQAIKDIENLGVTFAIASGRDYDGVYSIIHPYGIHCEAILGNGAQYIDSEGNLILTCYMNKEVVEDVVNIFTKRNIPVMIFTTKGFYTTYEPNFVKEAFVKRAMKRFKSADNDYDDGGRFASSPCNHLIKINDFNEFINQDLDIIKVEAFSLDENQSKEVKEELKNIDTIAYLSSFNDNVEVTDFNGQKGLILEKVIELKGLSKDEVAIIGDGMNDLSMFERFDNSFAPSNSDQEILKIAKHIVSDNDHDAVCEAINICKKI